MRKSKLIVKLNGDTVSELEFKAKEIKLLDPTNGQWVSVTPGGELVIDVPLEPQRFHMGGATKVET